MWPSRKPPKAPPEPAAMWAVIKAQGWALLVVVIGFGVLGVVEWRDDAQEESRDRERDAEICAIQAENRTGLRDVIADGIGDIDRDGEPDRPANANLLAALESPQFARLDPANQDFWRLILTGLASDGPSSRDLLVARLKSLPPIECRP